MVWVGVRVWCVCSGEPRASARAEDCRYAQAGSFPTLALNRCVAYVLGHYPGTLRMGDTRITQAPTHSSGHVWMCVYVRVRRGRMRRRQHCKRETGHRAEGSVTFIWGGPSQMMGAVMKSMS